MQVNIGTWAEGTVKATNYRAENGHVFPYNVVMDPPASGGDGQVALVPFDSDDFVRVSGCSGGCCSERERKSE